MPPINRETVATTALALISPSAWRCTRRDVVGQTRNPPCVQGQILGFSGRARCRRIDDLDAADHHVVADATELVADDPEVTRLGRRYPQPVVVARHHLEVDVERMEREPVVYIDGGEVEDVLGVLLQPERWRPEPHLTEQIDVAAGRRLDDRDAVWLLAHLVGCDELLGAGPVRVRLDSRPDSGGVLTTLPVPERHHGEQHQAPGEGDSDPHLLCFFRRLPPNAAR
jgi:hypothetical protein